MRNLTNLHLSWVTLYDSFDVPYSRTPIATSRIELRRIPTTRFDQGGVFQTILLNNTDKAREFKVMHLNTIVKGFNGKRKQSQFILVKQAVYCGFANTLLNYNP